MNSKKVLKLIVVCLIFSLLFLVGFTKYNSTKSDDSYRTVVSETSETFFEGTVYKDETEDSFITDSSYDLGLNVYGQIIFKNPEKALEQAEIDFKDGFDAIQKNFNLKDISAHDYDLISDYTMEYFPEDEYLGEQVAVVQGFLDIYENSFSIFKTMPN